MEKETELYLIKQIKKLETELCAYRNADYKTTFWGVDCEVLFTKAKAFDELVAILGITYEPTSNHIVITNNEYLSVKGLPHIYLNEINIDAIRRGLEAKK